MTLRTRMALLFIGLVALLLAIFGIYVYVKSTQLRASEFGERLHERADIALRVAIGADKLQAGEKAQLQGQFLRALPNEALVVYGPNDSLIFEQEGRRLRLAPERLNLARAEGYHTWAEGKRQYLVDVMTSAGRQYYVAVVAEDLEGYSQLYNLRDSLVWGGLFGVALAGGIAWLFAGWSMAPVRELIRQALAIQNPSQRLEVLETEDELGGLSNAFNRLLMRLQESFEMQRSFISNASHELRTPLTVLQAELEQLQQLAEKHEEQALIESAKASTTHLATLVQQLLWLAQSSQAPENVPLEHLRLDEIAYEALQQARRLYPSRELVLDVSTLEADNTEPMVLGNPTLLRAACYNLLSNACKYATQGTAVLVGVRQQNGRVLFTVADKGPGLPAEELVKLKEPFYRSPAVSSQTGSGIGLALTDRIATLHNGHLTLQATLGAAFVAELSLPLASSN